MQALMLRILMCALALPWLATARAQVAAPDAIPKTIRIVVPFSSGGSNDVIARALAAALAKRLDVAVIVENKAGGSGTIGGDFVAKAPRDGSVLLLTSSSLLTVAATQARMPYDTLTAFAPVAMVGRGPMLLVVSTARPYKTLTDWLDAARANPGVLNYGTAGVGSIGHLATAQLDDMAKIRQEHVAYKGASNAALDLASGHIHMMISNYSTVAPLIRAGKIRPLGVTSAAPHPAFPELPPLATVAPGFNVDIWVGVFAPAGTPAAIVNRLNREISAIAASPDLAPVLEPDGTLAEAISPAVFTARIKDELAQWKQIAATHKIVSE